MTKISLEPNLSVVEVAEGPVFRVWILCGEAGAVQVLDLLEEARHAHPTLANDMANLLFQYVPSFGPPVHNPNQWAALFANEIFELKATEFDASRRKKSMGLRVSVFFDPDVDGVLVGARCFFKASVTPKKEVPEARRLRERYIAAKRSGRLEVRPL